MGHRRGGQDLPPAREQLPGCTGCVSWAWWCACQREGCRVGVEHHAHGHELCVQPPQPALEPRVHHAWQWHAVRGMAEERGWMQTLTCLQGFEVGQYVSWGCASRMREQRGRRARWTGSAQGSAWGKHRAMSHNPFSILGIWHWASFIHIPALWHAPGHCPFRASFDGPPSPPPRGAPGGPSKLVLKE